jgi:hypothetical protein
MAIISAIAEENRMGLVVGIFGACFHDPLPLPFLALPIFLAASNGRPTSDRMRWDAFQNSIKVISYSSGCQNYEVQS